MKKEETGGKCTQICYWWSGCVAKVRKYSVSLLWCLRTRQLYRIDILHPPRHPVKAAILRDTVKGTVCRIHMTVCLSCQLLGPCSVELWDDWGLMICVGCQTDRLGPNVRECPGICLEERKTSAKISCQDSPNSEKWLLRCSIGTSPQSGLWDFNEVQVPQLRVGRKTDVTSCLRLCARALVLATWESFTWHESALDGSYRLLTSYSNNAVVPGITGRLRRALITLRS